MMDRNEIKLDLLNNPLPGDVEVNGVTYSPVDISSEDFRIYTYGSGKEFRIERPALLYLLDDNKTHRIVDMYGMTHRPERDWVGISWKTQRDQPPFNF